MLKITITPKTIQTPTRLLKTYVAIATLNATYAPQSLYATGNTHTNALENIIKLIQ